MPKISFIRPLNAKGKIILKNKEDGTPRDVKMVSHSEDKFSISYWIDGAFNLQDLVNDVSTPVIEIRMIIMTLVLLSLNKTPNKLFHRFHKEGKDDSSRNKLIALIKTKSAAREEILGILNDEEKEYLEKLAIVNAKNKDR